MSRGHHFAHVSTAQPGFAICSIVLWSVAQRGTLSFNLSFSPADAIPSEIVAFNPLSSFVYKFKWQCFDWAFNVFTVFSVMQQLIFTILTSASNAAATADPADSE